MPSYLLIMQYAAKYSYHNLLLKHYLQEPQVHRLYNRKLASLLDNHAPVRNKVVTLRPKSPWFTPQDQGTEGKTEKTRKPTYNLIQKLKTVTSSSFTISLAM